MPPPNYSNLAAASATKALTNKQATAAAKPPTPTIVRPPTPTITGATGSQLAAASAGGALTSKAAQTVIAASQPKPPPTTTGYTGLAAGAGSLLAGAAANGALTNSEIGDVLKPPGQTRYDLADGAADNQPDKPLDEFRAGERNPEDATAREFPDPFGVLTTPTNQPNAFGVTHDGSAGDPSGWSPWGKDAREDAAADRWQAMADAYGNTKGERPASGEPVSDEVDANGNPPIPRSDQNLQTTEAARWTGQSIFNYGVLPNQITNGVAEELNYRGLGYATADEWMIDMGYYFDEATGVWRLPDLGGPQMSDGQQGYSDGYDVGYGDYGWGDYGYGGGYDYGGGGYGDGGGYGGGGGLIQWRIG